MLLQKNISPKCALYKGTLGFCCLAERRRPRSCSHAQKQKLTCFISTTYPYLMHPDMLSFGRLKVSIFVWQLAVFAQYLQLNRYSARKSSKSTLRGRSIFSSITIDLLFLLAVNLDGRKYGSVLYSLIKPFQNKKGLKNMRYPTKKQSFSL